MKVSIGIQYIQIGFNTEEEAKKFVEESPKYLKLDYKYCVSPEWMLSSQYGEFEGMYRIVFNDRTMMINKNTGEVNETAIKHKNKMLELIKAL